MLLTLPKKPSTEGKNSVFIGLLCLFKNLLYALTRGMSAVRARHRPPQRSVVVHERKCTAFFSCVSFFWDGTPTDHLHVLNTLRLLKFWQCQMSSAVRVRARVRSCRAATRVWTCRAAQEA